MIKKICQTSHKEYWTKPYKKETSKYCSWKCRKRGKFINCITCKKLFYIYEYQFGKKTMCSQECRKRGKYITCKQCSKMFYIKKYALKKNNHCSKKCYMKSTIGRKYSDEVNKKKGSPREKNCNWKGGKKRDKSRYTLILIPNHPFCDSKGYVREHRLVMEKHLGRLLRAEEIVHHINLIKYDNRPENLKLFTSNSEHTKFHLYLRYKS